MNRRPRAGQREVKGWHGVEVTAIKEKGKEVDRMGIKDGGAEEVRRKE